MKSKPQKGSRFIKMYSSCIKRNPEYSKGFTLIELLVVIAIIGILSSVVLASLNSARQKGQIAAIKSNLKNMIPQAELAYSTTGDYSTACASVANMITAINNSGGTASCYSYNNLRWGVSVKLNSDTNKNYSVDPNGVVTWDAADVSFSALTWDAANNACLNMGARLPSLEQLRTLFVSYGITPPNFRASQYWSINNNPTVPTHSYNVTMSTGNVGWTDRTWPLYTRCIY